MKMYYPLRHVEKQSLGLGTSAFLSAGAILAGEGVHATLGHRAIAAFEARTVILPDICTEGLSRANSRATVRTQLPAGTQTLAWSCFGTYKSVRCCC